MTAPIVRAEAVTKRFGEVTALNGVCFELPAGGIVGLLGRNGAGKTTLMQVLTGQQVPSAGRVEVFGADPFSPPTSSTRSAT